MIELNLTYEESKKILELGYDFSPVCPLYRVVKGESISIFNGVEFILNQGLIGRLENEVLAELGREKLYPSIGKGYREDLVKKNIFTEIIPIIPKAALEKCLPDKIEMKDFYFNGKPDSSRFVKRLDCTFIGIKSQNTPENVHLWFTSAYEAFIWCHDNYPDELRKKFEEVMR